MNEYPENRREKRKPKLSAYVAIALISAIIGGMIVGVFSTIYMNQRFTQLEEKGLLIDPSDSSGGKKIVLPKKEDVTIAEAVAEKVMPAVVGIQSVNVTLDYFMNPTEQGGVGTGVIVSEDGLILTNHHVITDNPKELTVKLKDGRELKAEKVWSNSVLDLGVIKIEANDLPVAELGDSEDINVGQIAIAIGNPLGLRFERTVTSGIISALNRSIMISESNIAEDLIQTDASINPGNSGGPLLNSQGQVIGINTFKVQSGEGLGFAIPINVAKPIILGIQGLDREIASYFEGDINLDKGILIMDVDRAGGAYKVGLRPEDIITHVDGKEVNTMLQLRTALYSHRPGDLIDITYLRNGKSKEVKVPLQEGI
jgi:S1-C subfamily serine protease